MVKTVASEGGDVFKYAGDAMIVLWPPGSTEDLALTVCRAGISFPLIISFVSY